MVYGGPFPTPIFSIHALLAESDRVTPIPSRLMRIFYPRSPCGERRIGPRTQCSRRSFSIHALLAESDPVCGQYPHVWPFSIHALLAESDGLGLVTAGLYRVFYPRSPCGERRTKGMDRSQATNFLSTLSLRRATVTLDELTEEERFLSTLSLRRATGLLAEGIEPNQFSIHALLAESDKYYEGHVTLQDVFSIHALLAESDGNDHFGFDGVRFSIHALLAESDSKSAQNSGALLRI